MPAGAKARGVDRRKRPDRCKRRFLTEAITITFEYYPWSVASTSHLDFWKMGNTAWAMWLAFPKYGLRIVLPLAFWRRW